MKVTPPQPTTEQDGAGGAAAASDACRLDDSREETEDAIGMMARIAQRKTKEDKLEEALRIRDSINKRVNKLEEENRESDLARDKLRETTNASKHFLTEQIAELERRKVKLANELANELTEMDQLSQEREALCNEALGALKGKVGYLNEASIEGIKKEIVHIIQLQNIIHPEGGDSLKPSHRTIQERSDEENISKMEQSKYIKQAVDDSVQEPDLPVPSAPTTEHLGTQPDPVKEHRVNRDGSTRKEKPKDGQTNAKGPNNEQATAQKSKEGQTTPEKPKDGTKPKDGKTRKIRKVFGGICILW